ncbi:hypothetical protein [Nonomuraea typhae]|uniref:Uncharacterized protein n=1 Tax=Nonomuraea typhae TaxID=2603600 RepID=A0ABW7ZCI4_9ACTN
MSGTNRRKPSWPPRRPAAIRPGIATARRVRDEASATCDRIGRTLREELAGLAETGFERTSEVLATMRTAWRAEDTARGAPAQHPGCRPARRRR